MQLLIKRVANAKRNQLVRTVFANQPAKGMFLQAVIFPRFVDDIFAVRRFFGIVQLILAVLLPHLNGHHDLNVRGAQFGVENRVKLGNVFVVFFNPSAVQNTETHRPQRSVHLFFLPSVKHNLFNLRVVAAIPHAQSENGGNIRSGINAFILFADDFSRRLQYGFDRCVV